MARTNFALLRVFAVALVIYGNGMVLTSVPASGLWGAPFARIGVDLLFSISGYLSICGWGRAGGLRPYLARRALRVMPGLAACVLVTVFIIGPLATTLPLRSYFLSAATRGYLANGVFILKLWLPGVFEGQQWVGTVNPMLWTLVPGVIGLVLVPPLLAGRAWAVRFWLPLAAAVLCAAAALAVPEPAGAPPVMLFRIRLIDMLTEMPFFLVGAALPALEGRLRAGVGRAFWRADLVMLCFAANWTVASWLGEWNIVLEWLTLPYMAACFGRMRMPGLAVLRPLGNPSYGMFLFAFPIQQLVVGRLPGSPAPIFTCMAAAFVAGVASWHLVERPALSRGTALLRARGWVPAA